MGREAREIGKTMSTYYAEPWPSWKKVPRMMTCGGNASRYLYYILACLIAFLVYIYLMVHCPMIGKFYFAGRAQSIC